MRNPFARRDFFGRPIEEEAPVPYVAPPPPPLPRSAPYVVVDCPNLTAVQCAHRRLWGNVSALLSDDDGPGWAANHDKARFAQYINDYAQAIREEDRLRLEVATKGT